MVKCIETIETCMKEGKPFFSFEYFPPKTDDGVDNLFERMDRMVSYGPSFCDITWGAGGSTADLTLDIADRMQNEVHTECMMHLTCTNMPEAKLKEALASLKKSGVKNILALRGDPPHGQEKFEAVEGGFSCALDLIKYIRKETGTPHSELQLALLSLKVHVRACQPHFEHPPASCNVGLHRARMPYACIPYCLQPELLPCLHALLHVLVLHLALHHTHHNHHQRNVRGSACAPHRPHPSQQRPAGDHFGICVSGYPEAHPDVIVEDKSQMEKNY